MRRIKALATAVSLCVLVGAAGCGGKDPESKEDLVDDISETLQAGTEGFDKKTADCFAEIMVEEIGVDELRDVDIRSNEPPEELQPDIAAATIRATDECADAGSG